jgi:hypothetical protein
VTAVLPEAVLDELRDRGPKCFHHVTPADRLPDIVASGGLLSANARTEISDRWGVHGDLGADLVCCGFKPHWGVLKRFRDHESAILCFDAVQVASLPGARLSARNTGSPDARRYLDGQDPDPLETFRLCREQWRAGREAGEILVPDYLPIECLRFVMFCDEIAREAWWPTVDSELDPGLGVKALVNGDLDNVEFPARRVVANRTRPVRTGVDRRPDDLVAPAVDEARLLMTLEDLDDAVDLYEERYGDGQERSFAGDFVDWPVEDDEPLYPE